MGSMWNYSDQALLISVEISNIKWALKNRFATYAFEVYLNFVGLIVSKTSEMYSYSNGQQIICEIYQWITKAGTKSQ